MKAKVGLEIACGRMVGSRAADADTPSHQWQFVLRAGGQTGKLIAIVYLNPETFSDALGSAPVVAEAELFGAADQQAAELEQMRELLGQIAELASKTKGTKDALQTRLQHIHASARRWWRPAVRSR